MNNCLYIGPFLLHTDHAVKDLKEGTLLIGTTEIAFRTVLLDKLHIFRQRYPDIKVKISCDTAPHSVSNLLAGKYELNLVTTPIDIKDTIAIRKVMLRFQNNHFLLFSRLSTIALKTAFIPCVPSISIYRLEFL